MCAHPSMHRVKDMGSAARDLGPHPSRCSQGPGSTSGPLVSCTTFYLSNLSLHSMGGNLCQPRLVGGLNVLKPVTRLEQHKHMASVE